VQPLGPGDEFGGYRIEAVAGRGGMGLVYRARQRRPDRIVAIKLIAPELAADPAFRARFERESAIAAQIEHPNVEPVYEVAEADGLLYIAMRYVDGVDLGRLLSQSGPLAPERAAYIVSQAADALDAARARGLVHRDIKPGNILVADRDHVYLTDFGLTKRVSDTRGLTATGMFVGTVDYIAAEQIEGRRIDARADVYALGCVLYEMLSGTVPFPRDSGLATLYAHVNDSPPPLQGVPAPLAAAVARAMAKRPADRFLSAGDLGRAVLAGAAGRTDHGIERTVATRGAAIADADTPTVLAGRAPTRPGAAGPIQPEDATATGHRRTGPSGRPGRFWAVAAGGSDPRGGDRCGHCHCHWLQRARAHACDFPVDALHPEHRDSLPVDGERLDNPTGDVKYHHRTAGERQPRDARPGHGAGEGRRVHAAAHVWGRWERGPAQLPEWRSQRARLEVLRAGRSRPHVARPLCDSRPGAPDDVQEHQVHHPPGGQRVHPRAGLLRMELRVAPTSEYPAACH
jgi:hypothetical protein